MRSFDATLLQRFMSVMMLLLRGRTRAILIIANLRALNAFEHRLGQKVTFETEVALNPPIEMREQDLYTAAREKRRALYSSLSSLFKLLSDPRFTVLWLQYAIQER